MLLSYMYWLIVMLVVLFGSLYVILDKTRTKVWVRHWLGYHGWFLTLRWGNRMRKIFHPIVLTCCWVWCSMWDWLKFRKSLRNRRGRFYCDHERTSPILGVLALFEKLRVDHPKHGLWSDLVLVIDWVNHKGHVVRSNSVLVPDLVFEELLLC